MGGCLVRTRFDGPEFRYIPFGITKTGLWAHIILNSLAGPLRGSVSGNPVVWALYTDKLAPEKRELGFCMLFCLPALFNLVWGPFNKALLRWYPVHIVSIFQGINAVCFCLYLLVAWSLRSGGPGATQAATVDGIAEKLNLLEGLRSTWNLISNNAQLMALCAMASFLTLADLAAGFSSIIIGYTLLGIEGDGYKTAQQNFTYLCTTYPPVVAIIWTMAIGAIAKRVGPGLTTAVWLPITCILFGSFSLLQLNGSPAMQFFAGCCSIVPISCFPPLTALVTRVVPYNRVGEALGCVASCKNIMALAAPLVMSVVMEAIGHRLHLYVWIFPASALIMAFACPFAFYLACCVRSP